MRQYIDNGAIYICGICDPPEIIKSLSSGGEFSHSLVLCCQERTPLAIAIKGVHWKDEKGCYVKYKLTNKARRELLKTLRTLKN